MNLSLTFASQVCVFEGQYCLPDNYDRLDKPYNDRPVEVKVDLDVTQILDINDVEFTLSLSMYFGVRWEEPRLISNASSNETYVAADISFFDQLWVPDVYIYNLKNIKKYKIFTDFAGNGRGCVICHPVYVVK